jgi:hypothetical protein
MPAFISISVSIRPALPTKGLPSRSSSAPGASPTIMILALGLPRGGTLEPIDHALHLV